MKRKSQLLALLMALCLLASLAVVPAAAATASELEAIAATKKQAWDDAESAVTAAESALNTAKGSYASEQSAYDAAKQDANNKKSTYDSLQAEAERAAADLEAAEENGNTDLTDLQAALAAKLGEAGAAKEDWDNAESEATKKEAALNQAKEAADIPGKESAVSAARTAAVQAKKEYEDAKAAADAAKEEENKPADKPTRPTSGDISSPSYVNFGTLAKNASSSDRTQTFTIKNQSNYEMTFSYSTPSGYSISGLPSSLSAGGSATVTVQLNATSSGTYNRTLDIRLAFQDGEGSSTMSIDLYAEVVESGYSITVDPASKDLGKLKEGYTEEEAEEKGVTVTVQNKGAGNVQLDGVKGNDHFNVTTDKNSSDQLKPGEKIELKIIPKKGLSVGAYTDTITFVTRENATAAVKVTVTIEKKLAPLTVEPGTLDFGIVNEGYTALTPKTVTVKNNTEYAIRLEQPTSYSYEISLLTQASLPAGGSTTFTVRPRTGLPANAYNGVVELWGSGESAQVNVQFAVTRPAGPSSFSDVAAGSTFAADIAYVSQKGLMSGVGEGRFNPQAPVTRGQLVTILYRLEGQPAVSGAGFPDVAAGSYCEKAVKWASANGITAGGKDGLFRPGDSITREQLATFLFRYNAYKGYVTTQRANLGTFSDGATVASYAKDALSWANGAGLVNGTADGRLNPSGGATRGQAAAILHRFCVSIGR